MEHQAAAYLLHTLDGEPFGVAARIAAGHHHDAGCRLRADAQLRPVEGAVPGLFEQLHHIRTDARKDRFSLRVAHPHVVFNHVGVAAFVHQAEENKSLVIHLFRLDALHGGAYNALLHLPHEGFVREGDGGDGAHAAGVQSGVALADALVILGGGEYAVMLAVCQHENGQLDAFQELFNDHLGRSLAEFGMCQHFTQFVFRLLNAVQNQHPFAGRQSVRFEHVGRLQRMQKGDALFQSLLREAAVGRCRDAVPLHEGLGEILAALQLRALPGGADEGHLP